MRRFFLRSGVAWLVAGNFFLMGCFEQRTSGPESVATGSAAEKNAVTTTIAMTPVTIGQWRSARQAYAPDIVVVDFWATWCVSCIERFPKMVDMHEKYANRGVQFVSVSLDDYTDTDVVAEANQFLQDQGATFDHYLIEENMMTAFEEFDLLGIPAVFVYNQAGSEVTRLTGDDPNNQFTDEDIEEAVLGLLAMGTGQ